MIPSSMVLDSDWLGLNVTTHHWTSYTPRRFLPQCVFYVMPYETHGCSHRYRGAQPVCVCESVCLSQLELKLGWSCIQGGFTISHRITGLVCSQTSFTSIRTWKATSSTVLSPAKMNSTNSEIKCQSPENPVQTWNLNAARICVCQDELYNENWPTIINKYQ